MGLLDDYQHNISTSDETIDIEENSLEKPIISKDSGSFKIFLLQFSIIAMNIASGLTTLWGINEIIKNYEMALLMTFGIQGFMTAIALIVSTKTRENKKAFLTLYIVPMIVSVGFNYIYFYSTFIKTATDNSLAYTNKIELKQEEKKLKQYLTSLTLNIERNFQQKVESLELKISTNEKIKRLQTSQYSPDGDGEGPIYMNADANVILYTKRLLSLTDKRLKLKEEENVIHNSFLDVNTSLALNNLAKKVDAYKDKALFLLEDNSLESPILFNEKDLLPGERHMVYESIRALENPGLFEWLNLFLAIILDFIILAFVFFSLFLNITIKGMLDE